MEVADNSRCFRLLHHVKLRKVYLLRTRHKELQKSAEASVPVGTNVRHLYSNYHEGHFHL
jgi:hypothetical protein